MGVHVELDLERVARLQSVLGADLIEIVGSLVASMETQIDQVERSLDAGRLEDVTQATHHCRNDALMVGVQPLLAALTELETASRSARLDSVHEAVKRLREVWPDTRDELVRAADRAPGVT
jgi:HPt (histidine-containing phosphotransfer) domain-containing protein